jgi:hypothetical protein
MPNWVRIAFTLFWLAVTFFGWLALVFRAMMSFERSCTAYLIRSCYVKNALQTIADAQPAVKLTIRLA